MTGLRGCSFCPWNMNATWMRSCLHFSFVVHHNVNRFNATHFLPLLLLGWVEEAPPLFGCQLVVQNECIDIRCENSNFGSACQTGWRAFCTIQPRQMQRRNLQKLLLGPLSAGAPACPPPPPLEPIVIVTLAGRVAGWLTDSQSVVRRTWGGRKHGSKRWR